MGCPVGGHVGCPIGGMNRFTSQFLERTAQMLLQICQLEKRLVLIKNAPDTIGMASHLVHVICNRANKTGNLNKFGFH